MLLNNFKILKYIPLNAVIVFNRKQATDIKTKLPFILRYSIRPFQLTTLCINRLVRSLYKIASTHNLSLE